MAKVLIIEDEESIREELEILLKNTRYEVVSSENFINVVGDVEAHNPDLILLDVNLQDYSGFSICTGIRKFQMSPSFSLPEEILPLMNYRPFLWEGTTT